MAFKRTRTREILSRSPAVTHSLGVRLARELKVPGVLLLQGLLGVGKTTLARGVAEGLGMSDPSLVCSPSFALVNLYQGHCRIYHVDLYRLDGEREVRSIGIDEFLGKDGVTVVEWSERLPYPVPTAIEVGIEDAGGDSRRISIRYPDKPRRTRKTQRRFQPQPKL